jgi:hypothetical protein
MHIDIVLSNVMVEKDYHMHERCELKLLCRNDVSARAISGSSRYYETQGPLLR